MTLATGCQACKPGCDEYRPVADRTANWDNWTKAELLAELRRKHGQIAAADKRVSDAEDAERAARRRLDRIPGLIRWLFAGTDKPEASR